MFKRQMSGQQATRLTTGLGLTAVVACILALVFTACQVAVNPIPGGGVSISIGSTHFTFTLGITGQLHPRAGQDAVRTAGVVPLFDGIPDDNPGSASMHLHQDDIQVIPLSTERTLRSINGTVDISMRIAPGDSTSPCTEGIDIGAFALTLVDGDVVIADGSLEVPAAALAYLITGEFAICLEATSTADVDIIVTMLDCEFGPIVDPVSGCASTDQCLSGFDCNAGTCVPATSSGCSSTADCGTDELCDDGVCVLLDTTCDTTSDCADGETCIDGTCVDIEDSCTADSDCATGETCIDGDCVTSDGFTTASIVHRGSELIVADYEIDSSQGIQLNGQYSATQTVISGDGSTVWINADAQFPPEGSFRTRVYRVNIDGSGGTESPVAEANLQAGSGGSVIDTNLDGSAVVLASGFNSTIISRASAGGGFEVINDSVPCTRSAWRLTDDGSRIVWASFCAEDVYTLVVNSGASAPTEIAEGAAFVFNGRTLSSFDPGVTEFDISSDGGVWLPDALFFDENSSFLPTLAIGTGLSSPTLTYQPGVDPDLSSISSVNLTDDGNMLGYCAGFLDLDIDHCYVHDVGSATSFEFVDLDGITPINNMVLADNGSRAYVQTTDNSPYGYFQTVGQTDRMLGGTGMLYSPAAGVFSNATLSDDGMTLASPLGGRAYVLRDGVDGLAGFPEIVSIQYSFDSDADTMTVRVNVSPADDVGNVMMRPLHTGLEPARHIPDEENPFLPIRFGQPLTETADDSGVWEHTFNLAGKKAFLDSDYRLRVGVANDANHRASFQDFIPVE